MRATVNKNDFRCWFFSLSLSSLCCFIVIIIIICFRFIHLLVECQASEKDVWSECVCEREESSELLIFRY